MDTVPGLVALRARKRELLVESQLNRQVLRVEVEGLRVQVDQVRTSCLSGRAAWQWVAPVAGFLIARRFGNSSGMLAKGSMLAGALGSAWKLFKAFRASRSPSAPGPGAAARGENGGAGNGAPHPRGV